MVTFKYLIDLITLRVFMADSIENKEKGKESKKEEKYVKSVWKSVSISFIILSVVLIGVVATGYPLSGTTGMISADSASNKAVSFIEKNMIQEGTMVSVSNVSETSGLYQITIEVGADGINQEVDVYMTKDGELFFPQVINIDEVDALMQESEEQGEEETGLEKSEIPEVHAFIMSYCPYGLQFMKAYIPVIELLGDQADVELNFVSYAMHGKEELDENLRMYCIQKEQESKLADYLRCFVENDDYEMCIDDAGVDSGMLESCIQFTDEEFDITGLYEDDSTWASGMFPLFPVEDDMNQEFDVRGSPTFVVNGKVISVSRSPEAIKDAICSAFISPPEECDEELSDKAEQPGIGPIGSGDGASSGGQC